MRALFSAFLLSALVSGAIFPGLEERSLHLPIQRQRHTSKKRKRDGFIADAGLGDVLDVTYTVLVQVGETLTPLVIDTGSADLWLVSDACGERCLRKGVPLYHQKSLTTSGQDVQLLYGDSQTGTHAFGPIGTDTIGIAGLTVPDQYFAAVLDTDTTVLDTGCAGILGLGFPPISAIWRQLLATEFYGPMPAIRERSTVAAETLFTSATDSFSTIGPLFTRLVTMKLLDRPLVATTLQRDTVSLSDHAGTLSLGALPFGLKDEHLTWAPVRGYTPAQGGLPPPLDGPDELYPLVWEISLDDVYFDGVKLPRSTLSSKSISLSALLDTGNSLIRGPLDVVTHILSSIGESFDCAIPHNLTFQIGGVQFPVDPRDFAHPLPVTPGTVYPAEAARCTPLLAATDPPGDGGFLYSWSLGDPFLKSALVAFYYGNMTRPSQDPPRVGLLSTVPANAGSALQAAVASAVFNGGIFPSTSEPAPYATPIAMHTMSLDAVSPQRTQGSHRALSGAVGRLYAPPSVWTTSLIIAVLVGVLGHLYV